MQCPKGHFCVAGSATPTPCSDGTYQNVTGQSSCPPCPSSYYCGSGASTPQPCESGHFCPTGTRFSTQYPCPVGTYNNRTRLSASSECAACLPGFVCSTVGIVEPSERCGAGHYCAGGCSTATPIGGDCGGFCAEGFVCFGGASVPTPSDGNATTAVTGRPCGVGTYCPPGSVAEVGCPPGTYNPATRQGTCFSCPPGALCVQNTSVPAPCPLGAYCAGGSSFAVLCPNGTYGAVPSLSNPSQCTPCPRGKFCVNGVISGDCASGYLCHFGNSVPNPENAEGLVAPGGGASPVFPVV